MPSNKEIGDRFEYESRNQGVHKAIANMESRNAQVRASEKRAQKRKTEQITSNAYLSGLAFGVKLSGFGEKDPMQVQRNAGRRTWIVGTDGELKLKV